MDLYETEDKIVATVELPGIEPDDVDGGDRGLDAHDQRLARVRLGGERRSTTTVERRYGSFSRAISLPPTADTDKVEAHFDMASSRSRSRRPRRRCRRRSRSRRRHDGQGPARGRGRRARRSGSSTSDGSASRVRPRRGHAPSGSPARSCRPRRRPTSRTRSRRRVATPTSTATTCSASRRVRQLPQARAEGADQGGRDGVSAARAPAARGTRRVRPRAARGRPAADFEKFHKGVELVYAKLVESLKAEASSRSTPRASRSDPNEHEALMQTGDGEGEPHVAEVFRRGTA